MDEVLPAGCSAIYADEHAWRRRRGSHICKIRRRPRSPGRQRCRGRLPPAHSLYLVLLIVIIPGLSMCGELRSLYQHGGAHVRTNNTLDALSGDIYQVVEFAP